MKLALVALCIFLLTFFTPAAAAPACEASDNIDLCTLAADTLADNPRFAILSTETRADEDQRTTRHAGRRARARAILEELAAPTWRDLYRAGYVIAYGDTREERMLALAIAIRTLSLAPDEPDARFLVAMTVDAVGRNYAGVQLYGRQKYFELDPATGAVRRACLPQMIDPPLPESVGRAFHRVEGFEPCPPSVDATPAPGP